MLSARRNDIFGSTSFRLTLVFAAVILVAFVFAGVSAWFVTKEAAERGSRQRIQIEMGLLQSEFRSGGVGAAMAAIDARQHLPGALEYRLVDSEGATMIGDLDIETGAGWSTTYLPNKGAAPGPDLVVLRQPTPGGGWLAIGEDLERSEGVRYAILRTLFWIGLGAVLLSIVAGYLATRGALRQMDGLFSTMERVGAGDLAARVPASPRQRTDIDRLGQRINEMLSRVGELVGNLRRVSTDIAHDLRTPISHVSQHLDEISVAPNLDAAQAAARKAQGKIDDLTRTFEAMLRLAEIEAGAARARFAPTELAALVERVADAYRPDIEATGRSFMVEAPQPVSIDGDADLLAHALANLLDNAIAHTPAGAAIVLRLSVADGVVRLAVADNGPGIAEADRARVLEPFVRLDASRSAHGVGLGLSIASAVARLHGATLFMQDAAPGLRIGMEWRR